ncbi:psbP domain-containing protein 4, chloroplastic isoform X2 [Coffea arabica]|uniref:PsbP domain-containing protein 4, chloroplastic isoform X2 n=1 Tax=Coffea arabica TaxID=13443 RepID=A0ABM4VW90_COFAR
MITISYTSCCLAGTNNQQIVASKHFVANSASEKGGSIVKAGAGSTERETVNEESERLIQAVSRRSAMASAMSLATTAFGFPGVGLAVVKQGLLAGRVPGLSEPNEQDLGGTEIDLRFANSQEGRLFVIVAPVRRFADNISDDAKIEEIGEPDKVIGAFGPEVIGENVEGKVLSAQVAEHSGRKYYQFELEPPHIFITATAAGNRLYLFNVTGSGLQWKRHYKDLKTIAESFRVI